jgi:hypothetical protein
MNTRAFEILIVSLWAGSLLLFVSSLVTNVFFLRRLSTKHLTIWTRLGKPALFRNNSISNNLSVLKFLNRKEYALLQDATLTKLARLVWMQGWLYITVFVCSLFCTAILFVR